MGGMRKLAALAFALSSLALFAERDMAIYRGKLTSDLNANGNRITSVDLPLDAGDAANKEYVDAHGGGCDTNAVDIIANSAVVTNALTVATTNRVAALETATGNLSSSVSSLANTKADRSALTAHTENTDNPHGVTAEQIGALSMFSPYSGSELTFSWDPDNSGIILLGNGSGTGLSVLSGVCGFYALHDGTYDWYQLPTGKSGTLAVVNDISATNPTFSNAVLAVGLNIDTNSVAVLNEIAATFGGFPIKGTATTVGGLLAALAAAAAWLKKNKVGSFASVGGASATVDNGVAKLDDFFTKSNSLLNGRLAYERNETGLKDRAFNALTFDGTEYNLSTALAAVTPTASGQPRDLLIVATATAATTISFTAGTIKGDKPTIDGSGTWLITLTEYASGVWYCRQIKMEDAA